MNALLTLWQQIPDEVSFIVFIESIIDLVANWLLSLEN